MLWTFKRNFFIGLLWFRFTNKLSKFKSFIEDDAIKILTFCKFFRDKFLKFLKTDRNTFLTYILTVITIYLAVDDKGNFKEDNFNKALSTFSENILDKNEKGKMNRKDKDNEKEDIFPRLIGETNVVNIKKK